MIDYSDGTVLEEVAGNGSPTSNAIAAYEEYARAHLPRLFEEILETTVAEQTQPIEEGLRRALPGMVRDCHTRLAQNYLQHMSTNIGGAEVQVEALPLFSIEPLNLSEESSFVSPGHIAINGQGAAQPRSDSGYAIVNTSLNQDSSGVLGDLNNLGAFHGITNDGNDTDSGHDFTLGDHDWAALLGNNDNDDFFSNNLGDESM